MGVFHSYDIRGQYPDDIDETFAYRLGRAVVTYLNADTMVVGRDVRESSPSLQHELIDGMLDQGAKVTDAGLISTPMLYYLAGKKFDGSVVVTASHNPVGYNGFKLCGEGARAIGLDSGLAEIRDLMNDNTFDDAPRGTLERVDYMDDYVDYLAGFVDNPGDVSFAIDATNGAAGRIAEQVFDKIGVEMTGINMDPDGSFPNHPPNPLLPESQHQLLDELERNDHDFGVIFDADGDRAIFFDTDGNMLKSSTILALHSQHYYDPDTVVVDALNYRPSVTKAIDDAGMDLEVTKVGYVNIRKKLVETDGVAGAEYSGHYSHRATNYCDNSILAVVKTIACLATTGKGLHDLVGDLEDKVLTQVNYEVQGKDEKIALVDDTFDTADETLHIDGVSKTYPDYWFNVRKSNTEPLLRVTVEADTEQLVDDVLEEVRVLIGAKDGERYA